LIRGARRSGRVHASRAAMAARVATTVTATVASIAANRRCAVLKAPGVSRPGLNVLSLWCAARPATVPRLRVPSSPWIARSAAANAADADGAAEGVAVATAARARAIR
jgi:hypothetical protein